MTLSIIIPFYKDLPKLQRALRSIPNTDGVEVIVVDNSEGESGRFSDLREADQRTVPIPPPVPSEKNIRLEHSPKGAGIARNRGIDVAHGEWLLFLDADDWLEPNAIERLLQMADTDADVCYFMSRAVNEATLSPSVRNERFNSYLKHCLDTGDDTLLRYKCGIPVCKLIRASLLKENNIRFDEIPCCEDKMFGLKVGYYARKIEAFPERLYVISESGSSLSRQFPLPYLHATMQAYIDYNAFVKEHHLNVRRDSVTSLVWRAFRGYGIKAAFRLASLSLRQHNSLLTGCGSWLRTAKNLTRRNRRVIINADDFGLSSEVNSAVVRCFERMEISSTSLMVNAPATAEALRLIGENHLKNRVGLHFNLVEGVALTDGLKHCPRFADPDGNLCYQHRMWIRLTAAERGAVRSECEAQIQYILNHGIKPQHLDSHFHVITSPAIYLSIRPVLKKYKIPRVRIGRNLQIHGLLNIVYKYFYRLMLKADGFDTTRYFSDTRYIDETLTDIEYESHPGAANQNHLPQ